MKIIKTASKSIIKMSRYEWAKIGRLAGWWMRRCQECKRKMMSQEVGVNKDRNDLHYSDVYFDDGQEDIVSHGICNECGKKHYAWMEKDNPGIFSDPINNPISF